jgi:dTDP-4-dehydrorhamnose reductase
MTILVTGATGLLGTSLCPALAQREHRVVRHSLSQRADLMVDLTDREATTATLDKLAPDVVVNLVALTNVDQCDEEPNRAYQLNVRTVENLAAWLRANPRARLIHLSTDQVYDGPGPHREDGVTLTNCYALTKYAGEMAATGVEGTVLRTNFFGRSRVPGRKSFSDWLLETLREGRPTKVFTDVAFSPLSLTTLCEMIAVAAEKPVPGTFNLGAHNGMSKADFAFELASVFGLGTQATTRALSAEVPLKAYRPKDMRMDCARFEAAFGVRLPKLADEIRSLRREYDVAA